MISDTELDEQWGQVTGNIIIPLDAGFAARELVNVRLDSYTIKSFFLSTCVPHPS